MDLSYRFIYTLHPSLNYSHTAPTFSTFPTLPLRNIANFPTLDPIPRHCRSHS